MAIYLKNSVYVITYCDDGSSNCYVTCYYNQGRRGNTATYSGWTGFKAGLGNGRDYNRNGWHMTVWCDNTVVFNGSIKPKTYGNINISKEELTWRENFLIKK